MNFTISFSIAYTTYAYIVDHIIVVIIFILVDIDGLISFSLEFFSGFASGGIWSIFEPSSGDDGVDDSFFVDGEIVYLHTFIL